MAPFAVAPFAVAFHLPCLSISNRESILVLNTHWKPQTVDNLIVSYCGLSQYVNAHIKLQELHTFGILQESSKGKGKFNMYIVVENEKLEVLASVFEFEDSDPLNQKKEIEYLS